MTSPTSTFRLCFVIWIVSAVAACLMLYRLGAMGLGADEAQSALAIDHMISSGDWVSPRPVPPVVSFQKPPLYFWLTAWTKQFLTRLTVLDQPEACYRTWAAVFGIGVVAVTTWLAGRLFGNVEALLAGLMLATNKAFLFYHSARSGTGDTGVALAFVASIAVWYRFRDCLLSFGMIGCLCGLQSMFKPVAGIPTLLTILILELIARRLTKDPSESALVKNPRQPALWKAMLLSVLIALVVGAPWYIAIWIRHPDNFVQQMFTINLYQRATTGIDPRHLKPPLFYFSDISRSSRAFFFFLPTVLLGIGKCVTRSERQLPWCVAVVPAVFWILLFSLSSSKASHYVFPAYGFIAITIAAMARQIWQILQSMLRLSSWPGVATATLLVCAMGWNAIEHLRIIRHEATSSAIASLSRNLRDSIDHNMVRAAMVGIPASQVAWRNDLQCGPAECFYLERLTSPRYEVQVEMLDALLKNSAINLIAITNDSHLDSMLLKSDEFTCVVRLARINIWTRNSQFGKSVPSSAASQRS